MLQLRVVILLLTSFLIGCAGIPTQEMSDARLALKAAHKAHADYYVPENIAQAQDTLNQAEQALSQGQFSKARQNALLAKEQAVKAYEMSIAIDQAKVIWQEIAFLTYDKDINSLFQKAKEFAQQGDVTQTLYFASQVHEEGEKTLNRIYLEQAGHILKKLQTQQHSLDDKALKTLNQAELAYVNEQGKQAYNLVFKLYNQRFLSH
ncbi:DUF4398 domain-containing protein [Candidatus Albibeggiatoa sp. nov. NOAA]|uniref:DUF4398 domain-containing protein n=1 Tax=Candidatus Albibeggiatoa sp. nov. NOAA TaxID=3162724 RepID=UPI0032FE9627|nr:DUF4398 domain-containing protein [Thiotrichaceae bacterium]